MSIEGLIFSVALLTIVVVFIALPLVKTSRQADQSPEAVMLEKQRERLTIYYERVLRNIRDLDEDHDLGKISDADHAAEREVWVGRGVQALKALEEKSSELIAYMQSINSINSDLSSVEEIDQAISDAIEAAVAREKKTM